MQQQDGGDAFITTLGGALARAAEQQSDSSDWEKDDNGGDAWVLMPSSVPWAAVHFCGGAGFGVAPHITYDVLCRSLCNRLGVAIVATPFDLGTDHNALSKKVHASFAKAVENLQDRGRLGEQVPTYRVGHSLGARLLVLGALGDVEGGTSDDDALLGLLAGGAIDVDGVDVDAAAAPSSPSPPPSPRPMGDGLALIAFNNFGLADSVSLATEFLSRMQGDEGGAGAGAGAGGRASEAAQAVREAFGFAQQFANMAGIGGDFELKPSPEELTAAVSSRGLSAGDEGGDRRTLVARFEGDTLDSSSALLDALPAQAAPTTALLEGSHLTPVVFRLDAAAIDPALAMLLGNGQGFSFGSAALVEPLVDSLCEWMWPSGMAPRATRQLSGTAATTAADDVIDVA